MSEITDRRESNHARRVLMVEDDPDVAESFALLLQALGHDARKALDAQTALEIARDFKPDVAFVDLDLPGMNGYQLARRLRREQGAALRLYALTGLVRPGDRDNALRAGFDRHLVKPIDLDALQRLLSSSDAG